MKRLLLPIFIVVVMAAFLMGTAPDANALLVLTVDDQATEGIDFIVVDNVDGGVGTATAMGVSNYADGYTVEGPLGGVVLFNGMVGDFFINVTTGMSKPVNGPASLDLCTVHVSGGAGELEIMLTDTGFSFPGVSAVTLTNVLGGTTNGLVTARGFLDPDNNEFGMPDDSRTDPLLESYLLKSGASTAFSGTAIGTATISGDFSLTEIVTITHTGPGQVTSFNKVLTATPVPDASVAFLLGSAFLLGFAVLRRKVEE